MKIKPKIVDCKKCKSEAVLQKNDSNLLVRVKCIKCDNTTSFECFSLEAITTWERKNK